MKGGTELLKLEYVLKKREEGRWKMEGKERKERKEGEEGGKEKGVE